MTTPHLHRTDPPTTADERTTLESWLDFHRDTLALKCEGLSADQLRTASTPPSGLTLLGLVRHLTDVERAWFRRRLGAQDIPPLYYTDADPDADLRVGGDTHPEETFAVWRAEIDRAREVAATRSLDDTGLSRNGVPVSLRWVYLHMIEEYARHNGHADLIRERIDGATGE
ncbi:DinB family protein [Streptomyces sp. ICBB 8177]|uniref:DinB family protein n=1 Tax=Streptomyces sp. ICBB 8177 TaxID=563922 RepID=UPI000D67D07D|nr:DinB family protein [Streptomyces sp. ICBB 8177]PWI46111.1 Mini-circle protein [Streptomyces sp. ICBB 8177]